MPGPEHPQTRAAAANIALLLAGQGGAGSRATRAGTGEIKHDDTLAGVGIGRSGDGLDWPISGWTAFGGK